MTSEEGAQRAVAEPPARFVARLPGGGFEIAADGAVAIRVVPAEDGWRVGGTDGLEGWILRRAAAERPGFVLGHPGSGTEGGRTMPPVGLGQESGLRFLLLEDGRVFRIVRRGPRQQGFELLGWETSGAYLRAEPAAPGWRIAPTPAAGGLGELNVIAILFAAEITDAEDGLGR